MCFDGIEDKVEVSVGEKYSSANEVVRWFVGEFFNSLNHFFGDVVTSKLVDEFVIVDFFARCAGGDVGVDDKVFLFLFGFGLFDLGLLSSLFFFLFDRGLVFLFC